MKLNHQLKKYSENITIITNITKFTTIITKYATSKGKKNAMIWKSLFRRNFSQ